MRFVSVAILCILGIATTASAQINLCDTFTVQKYEPIPVAVSPGHFIDGYKVEVADVSYHITITKTRKVEFVSTSDTAFRAGTIAVGTPYISIPKRMIVEERPNYGWGYEVVMKNGWTAVFADPVVFKSLKASRDSKITWLYKSSDCKMYVPVSE
jgi:hypothetical protein